MLFKTLFPLLNIRKIILNDCRKCSLGIKEQLSRAFDNCQGEELQEKVLKVSVIGLPNSGKSTFINNLMDRRVCPTSSKVHTTRARAKAIFTEGDSQIIFFDTPGLVNDKEQKRFKLEGSFIRDSKKCSNEADLIAVLHDVSNTWTREKLDIKVINILEKYNDTPSVLVLNKIDLLKSKRKLLDITRQVTENHIAGKLTPGSKELKYKDGDIRGYQHFQDVFMVSSLTGNGLDRLRDYLVSKAKPCKWLYPADVWSDQSMETIIINTIKATLLDFLPQEIPYELETVMEFLEETEEGIITTVLVKCPDERKAQLVAGANDGKLRQIIQSAQQTLQKAFQQRIRLQIALDIKAGK